MSGLTVAQLIDTLMPLTEMSDAQLCKKYGISHYTYKHWKYEGTREDDPPKILVEAFADATGIPAWRIYYAAIKGDTRYLLHGQEMELDRLKSHPLFTGVTSPTEIYTSVSFAQKARNLERQRDMSGALRYYRKSLEGMDASRAQYFVNYIQIHMLKPFFAEHGITETRRQFVQVKRNLENIPLRRVDSNIVLEMQSHLLALADVVWFLLSSDSVPSETNLTQAEFLLHRAVDANLTIHIPFLQLHIARYYAVTHQPVPARIWASHAELTLGALHHPMFDTPVWFLDSGDRLPDGNCDFSWEAAAVQKEKERILHTLTTGSRSEFNSPR